MKLALIINRYLINPPHNIADMTPFSAQNYTAQIKGLIYLISLT